MPDTFEVSTDSPSAARGGELPDSSDSGDAESPTWVAESDRMSRPILDMIARFAPEVFAPLGVPGTAERVARLSPGGGLVVGGVAPPPPPPPPPPPHAAEASRAVSQ